MEEAGVLIGAPAIVLPMLPPIGLDPSDMAGCPMGMRHHRS